MRKIFILVVCLFGFSAKDLVAEDGSQHFLSFIMPCFNCSKTVRRSIDSIYEQKITIPFEIVCTDDASTDETRSILEEYENKYENFHIYSHEKNLGGGAASNTCVSYAQGDLLFRLDSDNVLSPDSISKLIDLLDATGCDGASVEELRMHNGNFKKVTDWIYRADNNVSDLGHCMKTTIDPAASGNYLFTRKSFDKAGGYPMQRSGADTFCFGFKQYATGSKIAILPNSFYWHLVNPNGYWSREERAGTNQKLALIVLMEFSEIFSLDTKKRLAASNYDYAYEINNGNMKLVQPEILDSLFRGYEFVYAKEFEKAANKFEKAITYGCDSDKIREKIRELRVK